MAPSSPRVFVLTADYPPRNWSGVGAAVEYQANALATLGVDVSVLVARDGPVLGEPSQEPAPRVLPLVAQRFPLDWQACDLIHLHSLALSELAFELRRRARRALVYTAHSLLWLELDAGPRSAFWSAVQHQVLLHSDHVIFLSHAERAAALDRLPELATRCTVIPNGVPQPPTGTALAAEDGPIVFAGRFARSKGLELLRELVPSLRTSFVFAGGHGDERGEAIVRELTERYPERCRRMGWLARGQLERLFARAALVLMPSRYEPCGLVALEAMRLGAPVLAARVGGLTEVVGAGSGGRLVETEDVEAWRAATESIASDPTTNRQLRARGPDYVRRHFSSRRMAERLLHEVYAA